MANKPIHHLTRGLYALLLFAAAQGVALAQSEQQNLVNAANRTLTNFLRDPNMTWLQQNIGRAKAVTIAPTVVRAGFIFGGSGGRAVTLARDPSTGKWVGPGFYTLASASFGLQAGISAAEVVTLVMTDKAFNSLLAPSVKLGGDASVAAGPVGAGAGSALLADFITFSRAQGVFAGLNLEGSVIAVSNDWNAAFYGRQGVLPPDILVRHSVHNKGAAALLANITKATK
jgi:SH3 domain-containing YSC84-like protein 1